MGWILRNAAAMRQLRTRHSRVLVYWSSGQANCERGSAMNSGGTLRWKMLALMLAGTVVIYVDRNVLGVLAPILKKELDFTTEQYSYVVSSFQIVYSFAQPVAGYLT